MKKTKNRKKTIFSVVEGVRVIVKQKEKLLRKYNLVREQCLPSNASKLFNHNLE